MIRRLRNVTITLDEATALWTRVEAARRDLSVSGFIAELLRERMTGRDDYEAARRRYFDREPPIHRQSGEALPSRADLHERDRLR